MSTEERLRCLAQAVIDNMSYDEDSGGWGSMCRYCQFILPNHDHDCAFTVATDALAVEPDTQRPTQTDLEVSADLLRQYAQGIRPGPTGRQLAERMAKRLEEAMR